MKLQDGVHLHLSMADYLGDTDRIGQSDMVKLHTRPHDWWTSSYLNPHRPDRKRSEDMDFGAGLHALLFEGEDGYARTIEIMDVPDFKKALVRAARDMCLALGKIVFTPDQDRRVRLVAKLIQGHPDLRFAFGAGMGEVSVLFQYKGTPVRARFDYLTPGFKFELKSFGGFARGRSLQDRAVRLVAERHYDIQRFLYDRAREKLIEFVREGQVFGASPREAELLRSVAQTMSWDWVWIFAQRLDDQLGWGPAVIPIMRKRFDLTMDTGRKKAEAAIKNYQWYMAKFGTDEPWANLEALTEPDDLLFKPYDGDGYGENDEIELS